MILHLKLELKGFDSPPHFPATIFLRFPSTVSAPRPSPLAPPSSPSSALRFLSAAPPPCGSSPAATTPGQPALADAVTPARAPHPAPPRRPPSRGRDLAPLRRGPAPASPPRLLTDFPPALTADLQLLLLKLPDDLLRSEALAVGRTLAIAPRTRTPRRRTPATVPNPLLARQGISNLCHSSKISYQLSYILSGTGNFLLIDHFCQIYALARAHLLVGRKGEKSTKSRRRIEFSMAAPRVPLPQLLLLVVAVLVAAAPLRRASGAGQFDVRRHLSTVTRYDVARGSSSVDSMPQIPDGCRVIHLNLVARHGTRAPTKKRIKELDRLAIRLEALMNEAEQGLKSDSLKKVPSWIKGWESRWKGRTKGGELTSEGEEELYNLATRVKERFQDLFDDEYHPDVYSIRATQVSRASASAVAFGLGLLSGKGKLGPGKNCAFSVLSESRASDICLRFFDSCETYKAYRKRKEPDVEKQKEPILEHVTAALVNRYHLNFTTQDVSSLWFLCKQEASLLNITNQACGLFNEAEVYFLEWTDDLEGFVLKGYGESINYRMGLPLLKDVVQSMEEAIIAKEENHPDGTYEKARLRFAHAETVVPFSCLLGLFLEGPDFEKIQREEALDVPPMPPQGRNWKGSVVAPFAGNNMLVLYQCPGKTSDASTSGGQNNSYFVQVLHNEVPVSMPGCGNKDFCPFEEFKERIVKPHLKHDYNMICKINPPVASKEPASFTTKVSSFFVGLFSQKGYRAVSAESVKTEL